jgi:hypothetical protein
VACDGDSDEQCQNGACDDIKDTVNGKCYDTHYWRTILIITVCCVFAVVVAVSVIAEIQRRRQKRKAAMENT